MRKSNWNNKSEEEKSDIINRRKSGIISKYGVDNASLSKEIKHKRQSTFDSKYDGNPMYNESIKEKQKETVLELYGVSNVSLLPEVRSKIAEKNRKPFSEIISDLKSYNIEPLFSEQDYKGKKGHTYRGKCLLCNYEYDFHFIGGVKPNKCPNCKKVEKQEEKYVNIVLRLSKYNIEPLFSKEEYEGRYSNIPKKIRCKQCSSELDYVISVSNAFVCPTCNPFSPISKPEEEIKEWLKSLGISSIKSSIRSIISPYELDIYLPDHSIAIEFNGLYWHSELNGKDSKYHLNKHIMCEEKDIHLIQIFEDEWGDKPEIVKSIIYSQLKLPKEKIMGRKCEIREVSKKEEKMFLDANHIQGYTISKVCYGLYFNNNLISLMSFRKPRFNRDTTWELLRYSSLPKYQIIGGFNKLLNHFTENNSGSIVSYSDRRLFRGEVYNKAGFIKKESSPPNYYYITNNFLKRTSRIQYQKHKLSSILEVFDSSQSEWENMKNNGYTRIWDCGTDVWILDKD